MAIHFADGSTLTTPEGSVPPFVMQGVCQALAADDVPDSWSGLWDGPPSAAIYCQAVVKRALSLQVMPQFTIAAHFVSITIPQKKDRADRYLNPTMFPAMQL